MSHLSRLMDIQFAEYINQFLKVYIDNLLIYSNSFDEHLLHIEKTLAKLAQAGLRVWKRLCGRRQRYRIWGTFCHLAKSKWTQIRWPMRLTSPHQTRSST